MPDGAVVAFDRERGRGEVESHGRRYGFHATRIADGSREIRVGAEVTFEVAPGSLGRWEAVEIRTRS